jgi:hypothetical protein
MEREALQHGHESSPWAGLDVEAQSLLDRFRLELEPLVLSSQPAT